MEKGTVYIDFDGTLHNTAPVYVAALRETVKEMERRGWAKDILVDENKVTKYLGATRKEMWDDFMPELDRELKKKSSAIMGENLIKKYGETGDCLFPGVRKTLEELRDRGYTLVFLSNCGNLYMETVRKKYELDRYLDGFLCAGDFPGLTKGEIIRKTEESFPPGVAFVGDRYHDMLAAKENGLKPIFCTFGFGSEEEGRDCIIIDSFGELSHIL